MSKAKFTKGKWVVSSVTVNGERVENSWSVSVNGFLLANVRSGATFCVVDEIQKANAHLIAAAPEMYEMLEKIHDSMAGNGEYGEFCFDVKELLAKARGEK